MVRFDRSFISSWKNPTAQLPPIIGTWEIGWLVSTGRREVSGIQIDRFAPGVIRFKSEPAADALRQRDIQPMVVCGALIDPLSAVTHVGVRPVTRRMVQRAFRHQEPFPWRSRVFSSTSGCAAWVYITEARVNTQGRAAAEASVRVLAYDRVDRIGI